MVIRAPCKLPFTRSSLDLIMINDDGNEYFSSVAIQDLTITLVGPEDEVANLQAFMDNLAVSIPN